MSYYYLISGLPDLSLSSPNRKIDFEEVLDTIQRNLIPSDEKVFRYVLYPNDNRNLLNVLFEKHKSFPPSGFVEPAMFSKEDINEYHRNKGIFPEYMAEFLTDFEDQFQAMSMQEMEDRLFRMFYEELAGQDAFLSGYYRFEIDLKEFFAAYNFSYFDFMSTPLMRKESLLNQLGKGKSPPTDMLTQHPYIEKIDEAISTGKPAEIEKLVDRIKWDYLAEVKGFFNREQVLVYTLRLLMIWRWQKLVPETGQERFEKIKESVKSNVHSLKTHLS